VSTTCEGTQNDVLTRNPPLRLSRHVMVGVSDGKGGSQDMTTQSRT
jgi:hypothetical protein